MAGAYFCPNGNDAITISLENSGCIVDCWVPQTFSNSCIVVAYLQPRLGGKNSNLHIPRIRLALELHWFQRSQAILTRRKVYLAYTLEAGRDVESLSRTSFIR